MGFEYPYVAPDYTQTYAKIAGFHYIIWKILFVLMGVLGTILNTYQLIRVHRRNGTNIQKAVYPSLIVGSLAFGAMGIDPQGYSGTLPLIVYKLAWAVNVACLYTVGYTLSWIWVSLLPGVTENWKKAVRVLFVILLTITWADVIVCNYMLGINPLADKHLWMGLYFTILAGATLIGTGPFIYAGYKLSRQLDINQLQDKPSRTAKMDLERGSEAPKAGCMDRMKSTPKIVQILWVMIIIIIAMLAGQFYVGLDALINGYKNSYQSYNACVERNNGDGSDCYIGYELEFFAVLMWSTFLTLTWSYWKIPEDQADRLSGPSMRESSLRYKGSSGDLTPFSHFTDSNSDGDMGDTPMSGMSLDETYGGGDILVMEDEEERKSRSIKKHYDYAGGRGSSVQVLPGKPAVL